MSNIGHTHGPTSGVRLWIALAVTLLFVGLEAVAGIYSHSLALLSDSGHNLSDAVALALAAFAIWIGKRPATAKRTFGYHRVAILTALFNAITLIVLSLGIGFEAVQRFQHPEPVSGTLVIAVASIAVVMNTLIAVALAGDAKHSLNSRAAFIHMAGDALSSFAVVITGIIVKASGWLYADPVVSLLIALFILYTAWGIVRDATDILLENAPRGLNVMALIADLEAIRPVVNIHDLHIWTVGDGLNFLSCHLVLPDGSDRLESARVVTEVNSLLQESYGIGHATIQVECQGDCSFEENPKLYCPLDVHHVHPASCGH